MPDEKTPERILFEQAREAIARFIAATDTSDLPAIFHVVLLVKDTDDTTAYRYYPIRESKESLEKYK